MQNKLDRVFDINARRNNDIIRLKQYLERLRCDVQMLGLNKKQNKLTGGLSESDQDIQEISNDSDRMITEQIAHTLDIL